jgi:hypothetical protein
MGGGIAPISEHRSRQEQPRRERDGEQHADDQPGHGKPRERFMPETPPAPVEAELVPAATLFAATLLANELPRQPVTADELKLATGQGWTPPESVLRLKDKTI